MIRTNAPSPELQRDIADQRAINLGYESDGMYVITQSNPLDRRCVRHRRSRFRILLTYPAVLSSDRLSARMCSGE